MNTETIKRLVLVVEDDPDIGRIISVALERDNLAVSLVDNAVAAFNRLIDLRPDLIITDVMMPGVDGLELVKFLKSDPRTCEIPILIVSARTADSDVRAGEAAGADFYFAKPFSMIELMESVHEALASSQGD